MTLIVGMMRSGGDTRYSLFLDGVIIWILGVPMAVLGGFILHLPVYWVYLMVMSEELTKFILGLRRYFSRKWINNLTETVGVPATAPEI
jgi:Na+-driven multidrug efflux pump